MSKPDSDACREDGTLKDASEMEWPNSPSEPNFQDDSESVLSYMSKGKKRKQDFSDEEDNIIMLDSQAGDKTDDEIELDAREKTWLVLVLVLHNINFIAKTRKEKRTLLIAKVTQTVVRVRRKML